MHKMNVENIERKRISDLEAQVARLEKIVDSITSNKRVVGSVLRKEMKSDYFKDKVDAIVVKRLRKSLRNDRGEEE
tara:strand:+ start:1899 stop:2126 length:228 start_codon:yes stop_codon:yes gene_type:complete